MCRDRNISVIISQVLIANSRVFIVGMMKPESSQTVNELTASSSQNSLTDGFPSSSNQSSLSLSGSGVAGYSQNPMPAGSFVCADGIPRSDLSCGEVAVFSGKYMEIR